MNPLRRLALLYAVPLLLAAAPSADASRMLVDRFVATIGSGDEQAYRGFAEAEFTSKALADYATDLQAAELAKIFVDTGGLTVERMAGRSDSWVQAELRDRMSGTRQCLTMQVAQDRGKLRIADYSIRGLYDAGPSLPEPSVAEVLATLGGVGDRFDKRGLMSGVLLIAKDDKVVFEKAYGWSSIGHRDRMTLDTRLSLASIGKSITGTAVAQLVDRGKLSYGDRVGRFLPDYPDPRVRQITIRQLLSHTSGLGPDDYYQRPEWATARPLLRSVGDYLKLVEREKIGVGSPPGQYLYSNVGYVLVGAIIERVTGQSFYDYVAQNVFQPAGMTGAFYPEADSEQTDVADALTNLFSHGADNSYIFRLGRPRNAMFESAARGGPQGGPVMSARDLLRFDQALRGGKLISAARLKEMMTPHSPSGAGAKGLVGDVREGLGIEVVRQNGHVFYGHTGGDLGVASLDYWYPDSGFTIILLTNLDPRAGRVLANVSRALLTRRTIDGGTPPQQHCTPPGA